MQELTALVHNLNRAMNGDELANCIDWVEETYDRLGEWGDDTSIDIFKSALLLRCVDILDRMPASKKFNCNLHEFMPAAELSPFQASTGEDVELVD